MLTMRNWMKDHSKKLQPKTRSQLYVAITRAKENLKLYVPNEICVYGHYEEAELSNFLTNNLKLSIFVINIT